MTNQFGKLSRMCITAAQRNGKTVLADASFTAPYKLMHPFQRPDGGIQIMPVCASAGIMSGDSQEFIYQVQDGAVLEVLSQSFDKIHKMEEDGSANRHIQLTVGQDAVLYYAPQPVIPFAQSAFDSVMDIHLADESAKLFLQDILCCGRAVRGERFAYRRFTSKIMVYRGEQLIYRDNTKYLPEIMPMEEIGMYEGFTHMANVLLFGLQNDIREDVWELIESSDCEGGITMLSPGDYVVRMFGTTAQKLKNVTEMLKKYVAIS